MWAVLGRGDIVRLLRAAAATWPIAAHAQQSDRKGGFGTECILFVAAHADLAGLSALMTTNGSRCRAMLSGGASTNTLLLRAAGA
jgi:hypothetical protein